MDKIVISTAEANHLRRLIGWVRCTVGQSPEEMKHTLSLVTSVLGEDIAGPEAQRLFVEQYWASQSVPQYVRAAIKALEKVPLSTDQTQQKQKALAPHLTVVGE